MIMLGGPDPATLIPAELGALRKDRGYRQEVDHS